VYEQIEAFFESYPDPKFVSSVDRGPIYEKLLTALKRYPEWANKRICESTAAHNTAVSLPKMNRVHAAVRAIDYLTDNFTEDAAKVAAQKCALAVRSSYDHKRTDSLDNLILFDMDDPQAWAILDELAEDIRQTLPELVQLANEFEPADEEFYEDESSKTDADEDDDFDPDELRSLLEGSKSLGQ